MVDEFWGTIDEQSEEIMLLIDDLLTVRRLECGTLQFDLSEVDVADLTEQGALTVFHHDDRTLEIDLTEGTSVIYDPSRLQADPPQSSRLRKEIRRTYRTSHHQLAPRPVSHLGNRRRHRSSGILCGQDLLSV